MPKDPNEAAALTVKLVTEQVEEAPRIQKDAVTRYLATIGRKGGIKGGKARKESLSEERRKEIARKAAETRWARKRT